MGQKTIRTCDRCRVEADVPKTDITPDGPQETGYDLGHAGAELCPKCKASLQRWWSTPEDD